MLIPKKWPLIPKFYGLWQIKYSMLHISASNGGCSLGPHSYKISAAGTKRVHLFFYYVREKTNPARKQFGILKNRGINLAKSIKPCHLFHGTNYLPIIWLVFRQN